MNIDYQHPREQIAEVMDRIYRYGMTTTSGGNLSVLDPNGDIWITPGGTDKGVMKPLDVVRMRDGIVVEGGRPSIEYPFHRAVYGIRPDVGAVVHAHPPAIVAFSVAGLAPDTRVIPQAWSVCGKVGFAPYAVPGSAKLGEAIAAKFAEGCDVVVLENHGVVAAGKTLLEAFQRFETLEFCARTIMHASILGGARALSDRQLSLFAEHRRGLTLDSLDECPRSSRERELRRVLVDFVHRSYDRRLMTSTEGSFSARVANDAFLITPFGVDRKNLDVGDLAYVEGGRREIGSIPSRASGLHRAIYADHPETGAIVTAQCPYAMAFIVSGTPLDSRTIPESYITLRDVPVVPYGAQFDDEGVVSAAITNRNPVVILEGDCVLATGRTVLEAFDRLEVAEATANALIAARRLGGFSPMPADAVAEIEEVFKIPKK